MEEWLPAGVPRMPAEVARVLAPGGRWVVLDMLEHDREEYRDTMGHQHLGFSEAGIHALREKAAKLERSG